MNLHRQSELFDVEKRRKFVDAQPNPKYNLGGAGQSGSVQEVQLRRQVPRVQAEPEGYRLYPVNQRGTVCTH